MSNILTPNLRITFNECLPLLQVLASLGVPQDRLVRDLLEVWNKTDLLQEPVGAQLHSVQAQQTELLQKERQAQAAAAGAAQGDSPAGSPQGEAAAGLMYEEDSVGQLEQAAAALPTRGDDDAGQQAPLQPDSEPATLDVASSGDMALEGSAQGEAGAGQQAHILDGNAPAALDMEAFPGMADQAPEELTQAEAAAKVLPPGSWKGQQPQMQQQQQLNTAAAAATAAAQGEDGRLTGGVRPTMVFVSAKEGRGLEDLLLEIDRKVCALVLLGV